MPAFEVGGHVGEDWPFTFETAIVRCEIVTYPTDLKRPHVTIRADGGATYGLNGAAMGHRPAATRESNTERGHPSRSTEGRYWPPTSTAAGGPPSVCPC